MRLLTFLLVFPLLAAAAPRTEHVFVISFDGGHPGHIQQADMPAFKKLAAEGAHTWEANTIIPSKTLPSHTSMLTGVDISKHELDWNDYLPLRGRLAVPTLFSLTKAAHPEYLTGLICGKMKFRHLALAGSLDQFSCGPVWPDGPIPAADHTKSVLAAEVAARASIFILEKKPQVCFIHFPDTDNAGHGFGWGSPQQMAAFTTSDAALAQVLSAIDIAGISGSSTVILTADHGGVNKGHNEPLAANTTIPWIAWGKGVKKQHAIQKKTVMTYDTAATVLWLLDIPLPAHFDGEPVTEAFE